MRRHERFAAASAAFVLLATAACAKPGDAGVDIKNLTADIVFGLPEKDEKKPDAPAPVAPQAPEEVDDSDASFETPAPEPTRPKRSVPIRVPSTCPPAAQNAFPEKEASLNVTAFPREGAYRFKRGGVSSFTAVPGQKFPISGFETRLVRRPAAITRNASSTADSLEYTFQTVQSVRGQGSIIITWLVRSSARTAATAGTSGTPATRQGDPERGITLKAVEVLDNKGVPVSTFNANTGLLLLPLPVVAAEDFQSVAIETRSGKSLAFNGKVLRRQQLDACGDVVDSWRVEGTFSNSSVEGLPPTGAYVVNFATQFGGQPVFEKYSTSDANGSSDLEFTVGTLNPAPLPPEAK